MEKANQDEKKEVVIEITENFKKCDPYEKGFISGFINGTLSAKKDDNHVDEAATANK